MYADASCLAFVPQSARFMQSLPPRSGFGGKPQPERPSSCPCRKPEDSGNLHKNDAPDSGRNERVCNIFRHRFSVPFSIQTPAVKGLRRASEATTTCLGSKYRKIGKEGNIGDFTAFSGRKTENIGLLCHKVRRFCIKSTEVCAQEVRCFLNPALI